MIYLNLYMTNYQLFIKYLINLNIVILYKFIKKDSNLVIILTFTSLFKFEVIYLRAFNLMKGEKNIVSLLQLEL